MFSFNSTKKYLFIPILLILTILFSGCSSDELGSVRLMNAEGQGGQLTIDNGQLTIKQEIATTAPPSTSTTPPSTSTTPPSTSTTPPSTSTTPQGTSTSPPTTTTTEPAPPPVTTTPAPPAATTPTPPVVTPTPVSAPNEVVGVWISFIELQTAFSGRTEASFRKNFAEMMDNCKNLGINTVFVHVRGHGDAYYKSDLFPWARQITGTMGADPGFDPLEIMIQEAHARNISFRAWLNPMRLMSDADMQRISADFPDLPVSKWYNGAQNGTHLVRIGDHWYLNPAYPEVRKLIADGAAEILRKYNVDGIHIDDYFYPPNCGEAFDRATFSASGQSDLAQFRLDNSTKMVKELHDAVKAVNSSVLFGISPQGSIQNCYDIYADVRKWASQNGYCDYIAPQLYYGFLNAAQPFERCLSEWEDLVGGTDIKLLIGLAVYKIGEVDAWAGEAGKNEWINSDGILKRQIELSRNAQNYGGYIFFSYRFLFDGTTNTPAINAELKQAGFL